MNSVLSPETIRNVLDDGVSEGVVFMTLRDEETLRMTKRRTVFIPRTNQLFC